MKQREREPESFESALQDERPEIAEDFAARLDAWAAEGFPSADRSGARAERPERAPRESARRRMRRRLGAGGPRGALAPAAGFAVALVALVAAIGVLGERGGSDDAGSPAPGATSLQAEGGAGANRAEPGSAGGAAASEEAPLDSTTVVPGAPPTAPGRPPLDKLKPGQNRVQEKTVSTTLSTEPDQVDDVADGVVEVTERYEGIVSSSNVRTSDGAGRATFALRIPAQNLQAFLAELSDLASVSARNEGTLDITAPFVSAEEHFADAKAEVDALVARLAEAGSASEIAQVRLMLSNARGELAAARAALAELKQRARFSQVSVTVVGDGDPGDWTLGDALDDALSVLSDLAGAALVALAVILPLGALAAAIAFGASRLRSRRRERALDD